MSLANIVSGVIKKESDVDRKKLAYFFRDFGKIRSNVFSLPMFLRIMNPKSVAILSVQETFTIGDKNENKIERIKNIISVLFPETEIDVVQACIVKHHQEDNFVLSDGTPLDKEKLMLVDVGLFIDNNGKLFTYKAPGVPSDVSFRIGNLDQEGLEELRDADLEVLLPTKDMWLINELTRNREAEIAICYFGSQSKREVISKVTNITSVILQSSIKACLRTIYFLEDFQGWETEKESVALFDAQYDYVLVIRGDRIDVHLPFENGHVSKESNGWLLLN